MNQPAAWAGDLFRGVTREETLGIFPNKNVDCGGAVKSVASKSRELIFICFIGGSCMVSERGGWVFGGGWGGKGVILNKSPVQPLKRNLYRGACMVEKLTQFCQVPW